MSGDNFGSICKLCKQTRVRQGICQLPIETLADKAGAAAGNIDEFSDQVRIYTCDEIF